MTTNVPNLDDPTGRRRASAPSFGATCGLLRCIGDHGADVPDSIAGVG